MKKLINVLVIVCVLFLSGLAHANLEDRWASICYGPSDPYMQSEILTVSKGGGDQPISPHVWNLGTSCSLGHN